MSETMQKHTPTLVGKVVSDKNDKTIVVEVRRRVKHSKYGKFIERTTKLHVHDPENQAKMGHIVLIKESKPISKNKRWQLVEIMQMPQQ